VSKHTSSGLIHSKNKETEASGFVIIRRIIPKGADMNKVHHSTIKSVEMKLYNGPLRKFNYLAPQRK